MDEYNNIPRKNGFVGASMALGIASIVSMVCMTVYLPFILGGLAIIFAILSKTNPEIPMEKKAKTGLTCGCIGLFGNLALIGVCVTLVFTNPTYRQQLNELCTQMYGQSFDQMLEQIQNPEQ